MTVRTVLVTGGTGFVGGRVLKRLSNDGSHSVRAATRSRGLALPEGVSTVSIESIGPETDWKPALESVSAVIHCAARAHVMQETSSDPLAEYRHVNVEGTLGLARQAAEAGVQRFVFLSSIKVNGEETADDGIFRADDVPAPEDPYGVSKREAEDGLMALGRQTGMDIVIIRPPLVYGPGVKGNFASMLRWVEKGVPLPLGAICNNRRSLVALDNLVDLIVTCIDHPAAGNQVFLAGDGEDVSTTALLHRLAYAMNRRARLLPVAPNLLQVTARLVGKQEMMRRLCGSLRVDISKAREILGWTPPLSLDEGLRQAARALHARERPSRS